MFCQEPQAQVSKRRAPNVHIMCLSLDYMSMRTPEKHGSWQFFSLLMRGRERMGKKEYFPKSALLASEGGRIIA